MFLLATATLLPFSRVRGRERRAPAPSSRVTVLVALLVCLIPTTIGGLLSAIGIAGMDRMIRANVIATSGRAVEAAGDVDVLLLDKTGTITLGDRQATEFHAAPRVDARELADVAQLASLADETPEGRSIVVLAKQRFELRGRDIASLPHTFHKFSAKTRMSGVDVEGRKLRKGAADAIRKFVEAEGGSLAARPSARSSTRWRATARHRSSSPKEAKARACSASSSCATSSKAASASASPSCGRWASRPSW